MSVYVEKKVYQPYELDDEQDMWVAEISYISNDKQTDPDHDGVIEVRAIDNETLKKRVGAVLSALNFSKGARG